MQYVFWIHIQNENYGNTKSALHFNTLGIMNLMAELVNLPKFIAITSVSNNLE